MTKNAKKPECEEVAKRIRKILQHRSEWLDLTGGDLTRGIDLLERVGGETEDPGAWAALGACMSAMKEWRELSHDLIGWALAARSHTFSKKWHEPNHNRPASHERRSRLIQQLDEAMREPSDIAYVIVALPKEIALEARDALKNLRYGEEVDSILQPAKRKSYKDGYTIPTLRKRIVLACHYCYGSGLSMAKARKRIADIVGEHFENLRNWERSLEIPADTHPKYGNRYREELIQYQIAGAVASGATLDDTKKRLRVDLNEKRPFFWWRFYHLHRLEWDEKYFAELGQDYQRALKEQKQLVQRRKR